MSDSNNPFLQLCAVNRGLLFKFLISFAPDRCMCLQCSVKFEVTSINSTVKIFSALLLIYTACLRIVNAFIFGCNYLVLLYVRCPG